jgi:hypothetical protein
MLIFVLFLGQFFGSELVKLGMRRLKTLIILILISAGGTFGSYKVIKLIAADNYLDQSKFGDVFTGYRSKYKKGASLSDKAAEDWKAGYINQAIDDVIPYVLISLVTFVSLGFVAAFKVYSGTWWS